jgi:hypothetical protein
MHHVKNFVIAVAMLLAIGSTAYGQWYAGPSVGYAYYPAEPVYYPAEPVYGYPAPVMVARPRVVYSPVVVAPVMAPVPVWGRPVVVGPAGKIYVPGRPVRNAVRAVLP